MTHTKLRLAKDLGWADPKYFNEFVFTYDSNKRVDNTVWGMSYDRAKLQAKMLAKHSGKAITVNGVTREDTKYNRINGEYVPVVVLNRYPFTRFNSNGLETKPKF